MSYVITGAVIRSKTGADLIKKRAVSPYDCGYADGHSGGQCNPKKRRVIFGQYYYDLTLQERAAYEGGYRTGKQEGGI